MTHLGVGNHPDLSYIVAQVPVQVDILTHLVCYRGKCLHSAKAACS